MSWITRCPECATIYKVVPDQLKVASGWLRCGHCQHAFDSTGLVVSSRAPEHTALSAENSEPALRVDIDDLLTREDRSSSVEATDSMAELTAFSQALSSFKPLDLPLTQDETGPQVDDLDSEDALPENAARIAPNGTSRLSRVVVALLLLLSLQGLWVQRHAIAAFWPATAPLLQEVCRLAGCSIQPWRAPERILIESSELTPREGGFVLQWAVRNASAQHLGMTALELKLHDAQGKVLVQRVLLPAEVGAPAVLMTGQSWSGRLHLDVPADLSVTGYRLLTFYP